MSFSACANVADPSSLSTPELVQVLSLVIRVAVDFQAHTIGGEVDIEAQVKTSGATHLTLDTRDLTISGVKSGGNDCRYEKSEVLEPFGQALRIEIPEELRSEDSIFVATISYCTSPNSSAVQWLSPQQTKGGTHPYLFTQCQAIHARSFVPCQDTPMAKITYKASVSVPAPLVALMSAVELSKPVPSDDASSITYSFEQTVPIPSYLLALAVGLLEKRDIGPRTAVWAEKEVVDAAAFEFEDTEKFLLAAEEICGPYLWGRYDLLCLPPSFPYGGMENPCLTFVTPTLLAGDKSLANVVAHEIAHSWTGNLVTNRNWESFWLNEGWTVYIERKIVGLLSGDASFHFHAIGGWKHLQDDIDHFGANNPLTKLSPTLDGIDPDDAFSSVPYEKGFNLLFYLETLFGRSRFEAFAKFWIGKYKFKTATTDMFRAELSEYFADSGTELGVIDWDAWLYTPGMPPIKPEFDRTLHAQVESVANKWLRAEQEFPSGEEVKALTSSQVVAFLDQLLVQSSKMSPSSFVALRERSGLQQSGNAEIRFRWYSLGIALEQQSVIDDCVAFLSSQGRMKFVRPLYRELFKSKMGKTIALSTFEKNSHIYHNIAQKMIAHDLS